MTPEEKKEFESMKAEIQALKAGMVIPTELRASSTIPFDVEQAFKTRLRSTFANGGLVASAKGNTTESIPVNTAAGTNVQLFPDAFLETVVAGTTYYIAVYT